MVVIINLELLTDVIGMLILIIFLHHSILHKVLEDFHTVQQNQIINKV